MQETSKVYDIYIYYIKNFKFHVMDQMAVYLTTGKETLIYSRIHSNMPLTLLQLYPSLNLLILSLTFKCHLQHFFNIRYHLVGQVYSLEELKNLTSFNTENDLMLNISVQGPKVTKFSFNTDLQKYLIVNLDLHCKSL